MKPEQQEAYVRREQRKLDDLLRKTKQLVKPKPNGNGKHEPCEEESCCEDSKDVNTEKK